MTVAPTLQKGLKRLFSSSILRIIAAVLVVVSLITMIAGLAIILSAAGEEVASEITQMLEDAAKGNVTALSDQLETEIANELNSNDAAASTVVTGASVFLIGLTLPVIAGILIIIAFFLSLVGVINVSKENNMFKVALYAVLAGIVLSVVSVFVGKGNATVSTILTLLINIADIFMFLYTCKGVEVVGEKLGRDDITGKYNTIVIFYCLAAVLMCIGGFLGTASIGYTIQLIGRVCSIISFFMYLGYLRRAIKAVEGVPTAEQA